MYDLICSTRSSGVKYQLIQLQAPVPPRQLGGWWWCKLLQGTMMDQLCDHFLNTDSSVKLRRFAANTFRRKVGLHRGNLIEEKIGGKKASSRLAL